MLEYLYLFCIVATISVFLATPLGFTPGTDLHVARVYQADRYVKIVREFAGKIRDGQIITNAGFDEFRKLWQAMEEVMASESGDTKVWSVYGFKKKTVSQVLGEYLEKVEDDKELITQNYSQKQ